MSRNEQQHTEKMYVKR